MILSVTGLVILKLVSVEDFVIIVIHTFVS